MADHGTPAGGASRGRETEHEQDDRREAVDPSVHTGDVDEGVTEGSAWKPLGGIALAIGLFVGVWAIWFQPAPPPPSHEEIVRARAAAYAEAEARATLIRNSPVIDSFGASPKSGEVGLIVTVTVKMSTSDTAAWPLTAAFDFGDHTGEFNTAAEKPDEGSMTQATVTYTHPYRSIGYHPVKLRVADARRRVTRYEGDPIVISINRPPDGGAGGGGGVRASSYTMGDSVNFLGEVVTGIGRTLDRALGDGETQVVPAPPPGAIVLEAPSSGQLIHVFQGAEAIKATREKGTWFGPIYVKSAVPMNVRSDDHPTVLPGLTIEHGRMTEKGILPEAEAKAQNLSYRSPVLYLRVIASAIPQFKPETGHAVVLKIKPL